MNLEQNDNFITTGKNKVQNIEEENPFIVSSDSNKRDIYSIKKKYEDYLWIIICVYNGMILAVLFSLIMTIIKYKEIAYILAFTPIAFIPDLIALFFFKYKIVLIKDGNNKTLTISEKNYYCCNFKKMTVPLEFIKLKCFKIRKGTKSSIIMYYINSKEIDLDSSNITNAPFSFLKTFNKLIGESKDIQINLDRFSGLNYENNIIDEIKKYYPKYEELNNEIIEDDNNIYIDDDNNLSINYKYYEQIIKLTDYFYSFVTFSIFKETSSNESFQRIDWIFSTDYQRICIGIVKNDKSYLKKYIFNTNSIDKFNLQIKDLGYCFKILLKSEDSQDLCEFKNKEKSINNLNIFIYIINGQINAINNKNMDQITLTPN